MKINVSIVEDDAPTRQMLADWVNCAEGFHCSSKYSNAEAALAKLPKEKPGVVLTDINLPRLSGIECVRQLKLQLPDTQFLMITVYEDADYIFKALAAGASGYLLKRTSRDGLHAALADVQAGGSPMTSGIARKVVQSFRQNSAGMSNLDALSQREQEVLDLLARGYSFKEIADNLSVKQTTVNTYVRRIYDKLHVHSRSQAVATYAQLAHSDERWNLPHNE